MNIIFLSENTVEGGHGYDMWEGMEPYCHFFKIVNFTDEYNKNGKRIFEKKILDDVKKNKIDFVFIAQGTSLIIDIYFLKKINELSKLVLVFPDTEHNFEIDRYYAQCADLVWLLGPAGVKLHELYGVNTIWTHGFSKKRYYKKDLKKDIDVSFIGGINRSNRKEYIEYLLQNGIKLELYGDGTKNGKVSNEVKNEIVCRSKINLNFTGVENNEKNIFRRVCQAKGRPMEVAMSGSFVLSEKSPQIDDMFEIEKEIDIFFSKEELLEKIKFYLKEEYLRERIAKEAYKRAQNEYETVNSFKTILNKIDNLKDVNKTYYLDKEFSEKFTSTRFYYMTKFLLKGKIHACYNEFESIKNYKNIRLRNFYFDIPRGIYHYFRDSLNSKN